MNQNKKSQHKDPAKNSTIHVTYKVSEYPISGDTL